MATPQIIRYILYSLHTLTSPSLIISLHSHLLTLYFPISSHSIFPIPYSLIPPISLTLLSSPLPYIHTHSPYLLPISPLPYSHIIYYRIVQCPYTPYSPIPIHCPISPHTRPCNLSVLLCTHPLHLCPYPFHIIPHEIYQ